MYNFAKKKKTAIINKEMYANLEFDARSTFAWYRISAVLNNGPNGFSG